jgi:hypothetical protein
MSRYLFFGITPKRVGLSNKNEHVVKNPALNRYESLILALLWGVAELLCYCHQDRLPGAKSTPVDKSFGGQKYSLNN